MTENGVKYEKVSYKYKLLGPYSLVCPSILGDVEYWNRTGRPDRCEISAYGKCLFIGPGYAWDGASGPTVDTKGTMRAALVHDALYQLMRLGVIPQSKRKAIDKLFRRHLKEDGVNLIRRTYFYLAVRWFGAGSASPK